MSVRHAAVVVFSLLVDVYGGLPELAAAQEMPPPRPRETQPSKPAPKPKPRPATPGPRPRSDDEAGTAPEAPVRPVGCPPGQTWDGARCSEPPAVGWLTVRSNVSGDRVLIDGQPVGSSGPREHAVVPGEHVVRVEGEGYVPVEQTVSISAGAREEMRVELLAPATAATAARRTLVNATRADFPEVPDACYTNPALVAFPIQVTAYTTRSEIRAGDSTESTETRTRLVATDGVVARFARELGATTRFTDGSSRHRGHGTFLECGWLEVASEVVIEGISNDGSRSATRATWRLRSVEATGALLPPKVGNRMTLKTVTESQYHFSKTGKTTREVDTVVTEYWIVDRIPAHDVDARIPGDVWVIRSTRVGADKKKSVEDTYYSDTLGIKVGWDDGRTTLVSFER